MKNNKKGFTLAELLIVIAIIAILIGIAIPVFSAQLDNARRQADHANLRSAYALVQTANILGPFDSTVTTSGLVDGNVYLTTGIFGAAGSNNSVKIQTNTHNKTSEDSCKACAVDCATICATAGKEIAVEVTGTGDGTKYELKAGT